MLEINYLELVLIFTACWILVRIICAIRNKGGNALQELKLLPVYICLIVIARFVYFPLHLVNGHVRPLRFLAHRIFPFRINPVPFIHLADIYDGWLINIIGNIAMFIPMGIVWPICFKKIDTIAKTVLAGAGLSLLIEVTQLLFYERFSDIDDLLL